MKWTKEVAAAVEAARRDERKRVLDELQQVDLEEVADMRAYIESHDASVDAAVRADRRVVELEAEVQRLREALVSLTIAGQA